MNVLVATKQTQGAVETDFFDTLEGELVIIPGDCLDPHCTCPRGCDPSFLGLVSGNRSTTATIVQRPDLDRHTYATLVADGLRKLNIVGKDCLGCEHCAWMLHDHLLLLDFIVGPGFAGDVIQRMGADVSRRKLGLPKKSGM